MKLKVFAVFFVVFIFLATTQISAQKLILPQDNSLPSKDLAISLLELSSGHSQKNTKRIFEKYNFEVLQQVNYEKDKTQIDHTSAYTFGKGKIFVRSENAENQSENQQKTFDAYLIVIRGTDGNEFYSDFDFAPNILTSDLTADFNSTNLSSDLTNSSADLANSSASSANSSVATSSSATNLISTSDANKSDAGEKNAANFAYNFLYSAEDIFLDFQNFVQEKNPIIILTGHSRGAAVANLLAVLLNQVYDSSKIFAYTFACPQTIKTSLKFTDYNIFNFINSSDIVPYLPLSFWGFKRAGKDIFLDEDFDGGFSDFAASSDFSDLSSNLESLERADFSSDVDSSFTSSSLNAKKINEFLTLIAQICPSVNSYYNEKHSLVSRGLSDDGLSLYEVSLALCTQLSKFSVNNLDFSDFADFENLSDLSDLSAENFSDLQNTQNLNGENFSNENFAGEEKVAAELKKFSFLNIPNLPNIELNSDFAPLFEYINFLFANESEGFKIILKEHLPFTYKNKIEKLNLDGGKPNVRF